MIPILATLSLAAAAQPVPPAAPAGAVQFHAKTVLVGDGTRLEDAVVLVRDGKIVSVGKVSQKDPAVPTIELDGVLTAGIVVDATESGAEGETYESARTVLPEARVVNAFAPEHSDFAKALAAGITSLVLKPSADDLIGGLTAVVKSHGGVVVSPAAQLAISFSGSALGQGGAPTFGFFGSADDAAGGPMQADGSPENTSASQRGARNPTSYTGALRMLRELFGAAGGEGAEGPIARAKSGALPVLLDAWNRNEVQRALGFAKAEGLKGALRGVPLAADPHLLPAIQESGLGVVLGPFEEDQRRRSLEGVAALQKAGVPVAFALDAPATDPEAVRLSAAMAVAAGADVDATWKALTGDAARIAGVADRVGLVAPGHDADLVLWSGHPLDLSSRVEAVYVDGARVQTGGSR